MSGGKDRKSKNKTKGWEEAGSEFYQESYPTDLDGAIHKDPSAIATLLPSKQNRFATTRRVRPGQQDTKTSKRRQSSTTVNRRKNSTVRRGSQHNEVQVAMLPDLSENLTDEERIWEEIHEIKSMPVPMAQKKEMKAQLQNATKLRLQGIDQIKWQRRKAWQQLQTKWIEFYTKMELWRNSLKTIEGNFGTGVVAYFLFLRWLMFLNLAIFVLILSFIVIPHIVLQEPTDKDCDSLNEPNSTACCSADYINETTNNDFFILDIIQGTGFMEKTMMFYGFYTNKIFGYNAYVNSSVVEVDSPMYYDLPLAYVSVGAVYLLLSLVAIVKAASREFKDRLVEGEGQFYQYCNLIFGGWDFCIHNEKSANIKHKAIYNEIKGLLQAKRMEFERHNRSKEVMFKLISIRLAVNIFVILILVGAAIVIYLLFSIHIEYLKPTSADSPDTSIFKTLQSIYSLNSSTNEIDASNQPIRENRASADAPIEELMTNLFFEFLPYLAIVFMNLLVPLIFNYLVQFERYSPKFVIKITLLRTVFLRLSSLAVLLSRFYILVSNDLPEGHCYMVRTPMCWETYVGQQFYKLFITDFATHIVVTFFINFPRSLLARHSNKKFVKLIGEQEFELSKHVLDVVYSQTLCWLGSFYAPFLPAIAVVLNFFMFYIKKFACLINSKPSPILYRASRSNSLFMFILLLSFVVAVVPVVYAVAEILPSKSCGPFRGLDSVWEAAITAFMKLPLFFRNIIFFFGTAGFAIPCFVVLTLLLYYYYAVSAANKHMVEVLKNQLVLEGHDKQFLLNRLSAFLKQQQEYQKKMRQPDHHREYRNDRSSRADNSD
ncbi:Transmembrane channel-like protein 7 [Pseudolycoriella hygida]|uniref:Transmembrane channel-like protein 7 n=1 Tax=Pseudolycoriella hygida TaxID=35572 RepID=A0A9Q0MJH2_9DIPT|nr:Transmembrane channel-like protein 7 [Pseudolycoriella hygida]